MVLSEDVLFVRLRPEPLAADLRVLEKDGGRMIIPLGETRETQALVQIDKNDGKIEQTELLPVRFVPLVRGRVKRR